MNMAESRELKDRIEALEKEMALLRQGLDNLRIAPAPYVANKTLKLKTA